MAEDQITDAELEEVVKEMRERTPECKVEFRARCDDDELGDLVSRSIVFEPSWRPHPKTLKDVYKSSQRFFGKTRSGYEWLEEGIRLAAKQELIDRLPPEKVIGKREKIRDCVDVRRR